MYTLDIWTNADNKIRCNFKITSNWNQFRKTNKNLPQIKTLNLVFDPFRTLHTCMDVTATTLINYNIRNTLWIPKSLGNLHLRKLLRTFTVFELFNICEKLWVHQWKLRWHMVDVPTAWCLGGSIMYIQSTCLRSETTATRNTQ